MTVISLNCYRDSWISNLHDPTAFMYEYELDKHVRREFAMSDGSVVREYKGEWVGGESQIAEAKAYMTKMEAAT